MWRRLLLETATLVSVLLCVCTCWLWIRGDRYSWHVEWRQTLAPVSDCYTVDTHRGCLTILRGTIHTLEHAEPLQHLTIQQLWIADQDFSKWSWRERWFPGFATANVGELIGARSSMFAAVCIPFWFIFLLTAMLPLRWGVRIRAGWRRKKRRRLGQCEQCGYDLRGTPDRCPECGASP